MVVIALAAVGCSGSMAEVAVEITVEPRVALAAGLGDTVRFQAHVLDQTGEVLGVDVEWRTGSPGVSIDEHGVATALAPGVASVVAAYGGASGSASIEMFVPEEPADYRVGESYLGRAGYVEYVPGDLPLVISAPHGGDLTPDEIPDRTYGTTVTDTNTRETLLAIRDALQERTGHTPHLVISHLRRTKLDPNREIAEAAQGNPFAEQTWHEFHSFIETAEATVTERFGSGLYVDLHGHGHTVRRVELGYLLTANDLARPDEILDAGPYAVNSSIRALAGQSELPFSELLRGDQSLGALLETEGVRAVPSPADPDPGGEPYFNGGYATVRHGSRDPSSTVSGVQMELHRVGVRDSEENRRSFAVRLARAFEAYMLRHYGFFRP